MAIGPFISRLQQFADVKGFEVNRVIDFVNGVIDYSGIFSLQPTNAHLAITGTVPTLGALQSGVASQSIVGCDSVHIVTIVTANASPPTPAAKLFVVNYANAWTSAPAITVTQNGTGVVWGAVAASTTSGYSFFHGGTAAGAVALTVGTTYIYAVTAIGAGNA